MGTRAGPPSTRRRGLLRGLAAGGAFAAGGGASRALASGALECVGSAGSVLSTDRAYPAAPVAGFLSRLRPDNGPLTMRAGPAGPLPAGIAHGTLAYRVDHGGRGFANPTLVVRRGDRLTVRVENRLQAPTTVHWHGLAVDTSNDGVLPLIAPGQRYDYAFEVRNRAGLYWYHPHPHGATAGQVHDGLFGLIEVEDDDDLALRRALDLFPGSTEATLVLQDRRAGGYASSPDAAVHGFFGDALYVNGRACGDLEVATRIVRLRLLNACNARTLLIGLRTTGGRAFPFHVIGNDGGLLPAPVSATRVFLASAERLDLLVDLRDAAPGDALVLETLAFDPMHAEVDMPEPATAPDAPPEPDAHGGVHSGMAGMAGMSSSAAPAPADGAMHGHALHGSGWPEGAPRDLLLVRVTRRVTYDRPIPARLADGPAPPADGWPERPLRLGHKSGRWRINDRVFAMGETPLEVVRGTHEIWLLRNYHTSMPHAMHLHGFAFEVQERETSPDQVKALAIDARGRLPTDLGRKDTVLVWPGESVRAAVRFESPFSGPQTYMLHCHNLEHEDGGMMLGVRVA